jgi:alpha-1,6-mannosyltransferase
MNFFQKNAHWFTGLAMVALTAGLGYFVQQHEFWKIMGFYVPLFAFYILAVQKTDGGSRLRFFVAVAILLRLLLVFSLPNLSNDVYRFIWDGRLLVQGYNPFDHLPAYYLGGGESVPGIGRVLFEAYGAKNFYTVYPPVAQVQFASAVWLFPKSILGASIVMKLWLFASEVASIFLIIKLLKRFRLPARNVLLYALNPLIIVEITGNLHFEGAMIFFLLLALWLLVKCRPQTANCQLPTANCLSLSAAAFAFSICSKLLTVLFLPFFIKYFINSGRVRNPAGVRSTWTGWRISILYFTITGAITVLLFLPIVNATFPANFGGSLNLYFQKLEYNASLYYLLRWVGYHIFGYNLIASIGPGLGMLAMAGILWMAFFKKQPAAGLVFFEKKLPELWLFAITLYLLCTTTMHPWYLALPLVLCVFTRWRFPVVWSGLIFLTYVNYSYEPYRENLWVVALEYGVVAIWFLGEWKSKAGKTQSSAYLSTTK